MGFKLTVFAKADRINVIAKFFGAVAALALGADG